MIQHSRSFIECRSRPPAEALPGEECPLPFESGVPPGMASYVWARSGQCCEFPCCRRMAETVVRTRAGRFEARCGRCLEAGR